VTFNYRIEHLDFFGVRWATGRGLSTALRGRSCQLAGSQEDVFVANSPDSLIEDTFQVSLRQCRAFKVLVGSNLLCARQCLIVRHGFHPLLTKGVEGGGILSQVELGADENDRNIGGVVVNLGVPLGLSLAIGPRYITTMRHCQDLQSITLAFTLSNDGGLTIEKQIKKTSV
jgi:hypothetical protein